MQRLTAPAAPKYLTINDLCYVVLGMVAIVDVLGLLEVEEGDPVLQVTDLVAYRNPVGRSEDAVLRGFVEDGDLFEHF